MKSLKKLVDWGFLRWTDVRDHSGAITSQRNYYPDIVSPNEQVSGVFFKEASAWLDLEFTSGQTSRWMGENTRNSWSPPLAIEPNSIGKVDVIMHTRTGRLDCLLMYDRSDALIFKSYKYADDCSLETH